MQSLRKLSRQRAYDYCGVGDDCASCPSTVLWLLSQAWPNPEARWWAVAVFLMALFGLVEAWVSEGWHQRCLSWELAYDRDTGALRKRLQQVESRQLSALQSSKFESLGLLCSVPEMTFFYPPEEWLEDWGRILEESLTVSAGKSNEFAEKLFRQRYANRDEADWKRHRVLLAYRYLDRNAESFEKGAWIIASKKQAAVANMGRS